jgi:hexokinase
MGNAFSKSPDEKLVDEVITELCFTQSELQDINRSFLSEMNRGWDLGKGEGATADQSSLKMISSHINILPDGNEVGVFFAVDLGGTNLRVLRVALADGKATIKEHREAIPARVISKHSNCEDLFDFIAIACSRLTGDITEDSPPMPLGFTFSFPCAQFSIKSGKLIEWTKGFETRGCVGQDPARLLQDALDRQKVPLVVDALCNDTVGTLMTNTYQKKSKYCRIGVILGTGTNAAYSDPELDDLIMNIEWGGFNKLPRRTSFDEEVDKTSPNPGKQFLEKMVSGLYLGEIARLATLRALAGTSLPSILTQPHSISTANISNLLTGEDIENSPLNILDTQSLGVLKRISEAVLDRSAAVAAAVLSSVIHKATSGKESRRCEVGIDGSLFTKGHEYKTRLMKYLRYFYPDDAIELDFSEDGSGLGAALVAAAISRGRQVSDRS